MSYQVLARKYRPQIFAQVVGQDHVTTTLRNAIAAGRLHHAYLFVGVRGTGKTTVARILAKALNCRDKKDFEPCGLCGPCAEISNGTSLDVQEIDGASNTSVDDVRELRERIKFLPSSGPYRIYIIDEVHMLSTSAFNALLKTLEEPPSHVVFIFATTEAHKIPATILSRCQRYDFRRIPPPAIVSTLTRIAKEEGVSIGEGALTIIAREATGSLRDAESLFDQAIAFSGGQVNSDTIKSMLGFLDRQRLFDVIEAVINRDPLRALAVLDEVFLTGADLAHFAAEVLELIRHMLILAECGDERGAIDIIPDELGRLKELLPRTGAAELHQMFSLWYRTADEIGRSPFPKMFIEVGLMRLVRIGPVKPIEDIVAKIDALLEAGDDTHLPVTEDLSSTKLPVSSLLAAPEGQRVVKNVNSPIVSAVASKTQESSLAFAPVISLSDVNIDERWQDFIRWLLRERPQVASLLQNGVLVGIDGSVVKLRFDNQMYAEMFSEEDRRKQTETLLESFFKTPMGLSIDKKCSDLPQTNVHGEHKKELVREVLGSDIVRQATDILGARVYDVKVEGEK